MREIVVVEITTAGAMIMGGFACFIFGCGCTWWCVADLIKMEEERIRIAWKRNTKGRVERRKCQSVNYECILQAP
jgi:hypothetical protein